MTTVALELGTTLSTPGALAALEDAGETPVEFLARHAAGDWGEVGAEDWASNDAALENETRILSAYRLATGVKIWIITEADRSATTILLPEEY